MPPSAPAGIMSGFTPAGSAPPVSSSGGIMNGFAPTGSTPAATSSPAGAPAPAPLSVANTPPPPSASGAFSGFLKSSGMIPSPSMSMNTTTPAVVAPQRPTVGPNGKIMVNLDNPLAALPAISSKISSDINKPIGMVSDFLKQNVHVAPEVSSSVTGQILEHLSNLNPANLAEGLTAGFYQSPATQRQNAANTKADTSSKAVDPTLVNTQATALTALQAKIDAAKAKVDTTSQKSIDSFNAMIADYNKQLKTYQTSKAAYDTSVSTANADVTNANSLKGDFIDQTLSALTKATGAVIGIMAGGELATPAAAVNGLKTMLNQSPLLAKYAVPYVEGFVKTLTGLSLQTQLDPNLAGDLTKRVQTLGTAIATAPLYTALGLIKNAGISIPASFGLGFGMAKLSGASNSDAVQSGLVFGIMDGVMRGYGAGNRGLTPDEIQIKLKDEAARILNQYAPEGIVIKHDSSIEDIKAAYHKAAFATHPDTGGNAKDFTSIKNAFDLLSKGATGKNETVPTTEPEKQVKALTTDVKSSIAKNGDVATHTELTNIGVHPDTATTIVERAKAQAVLEKINPVETARNSDPLLKLKHNEALARIEKGDLMGAKLVSDSIYSQPGSGGDHGYTLINDINNRVTQAEKTPSPTPEKLPANAKMEKGDTIALTHIKSGEVTHAIYQGPGNAGLNTASSHSSGGVMALEPQSGIPMRYPSDRFSVKLVKKGVIEKKSVPKKVVKPPVKAAAKEVVPEKGVTTQKIVVEKTEEGGNFVLQTIKDGKVISKQNFSTRAEAESEMSVAPEEQQFDKLSKLITDYHSQEGYPFAQSAILGNIERETTRLESLGIENIREVASHMMFGDKKDNALTLRSEDAKKGDELKINEESVKRPDILVSKSELKNLINTFPNQEADFKVTMHGSEMRMDTATPNGKQSLRPSALGLVESQLREGDVIHVDSDNLKAKGTSFRVVNKDNKVEAMGGGSTSNTRMVKPTFSNQMSRGFVNPGEIIKQASEYLEKTSSTAAAAKNLDDEIYNVGKNNEADAIESNKLLKEFRKISPEDVRMIDIYRDELEAGLTPPALTPEQQRLNDEIINPLLKDAAGKAAYIRAKGVEVDIAPPMDHETYNPRMTKDKGGVIDAAVRTKNKLLNRSGAGKKNILSQSASSLKPRVHGALTYENGQRVTTSHVDGHILQHNVDGTTTDLGPTKQKVSTKVKEFFDPEVRGKLEQLAKDLGIKHERHATGRTLGLGGKRAGVSFTGENLIKTRLGPDSVLAHEIGHQIDDRYGLQAFMSEDRFDARHKAELTREMRALADERFAGAETTKGFKAYVRKGSEKMAVMFEAYISNEQLFKDVAPHLYDDFRQFLSDHAELRPFLDIKGSVQLSSVTHGGEYLGGKKGDTFIDKFGRKGTLGDATKAEIERVTTTRYYHNPFLAAVLTHENITQVYRAVKMLEDFKNSPKFSKVALEKGTGTPPDDWKLGPIDQFRNYFVEPDTWKVMNAYKNELESGNDPIRPLTMLNNFMLHTMFLAPVKHGMNVAVTAFANRGLTRWMNPLAYPTLVRTSIKAINDVLRQNEDFLTTLRDGASFMSAKKDYQGRQDDILALIGEETDTTKKVYQLAKKTVGAVTPFNWVHAMVWPMTDIFMHQAILEGLAKQGLTVKTSTSAQRMAIIQNVGKTIPTYRQSVGMRQAPSWVRRNALVFMSWRESMYRNMYTIGREMITGEDKTKPRVFTQKSDGSNGYSYNSKESWKTRGEAFNKASAIAFLSLIVWPYLQDEWRKLSKNANASIFMPSFLGIIDNANKFASGKIDIGQYIMTLVDMPPMSRESLQQIINTDIFTHQAIRDKTTTAGEQFNQTLQHAEKSATVLDQYNRINSGALSWKQLVESQVGLNDPDAVQTKLTAAVATAQTRVDKIDSITVERVTGIYNQAKTLGFGTPEADALVSPLNAADLKIYQDLKTIDQAKETVALSAKIQPIVNQAYQLGFGTPEADALVANLSDAELRAYHAIKTILYGAKGTGQPNFTPGTTTNDTSIIGSVLAYADAIRTDPLTAFERIFTGQRILRTENGTIIVERNSPLEARVKAQLGGTTEMTLDHVRSFEIGGDNSSGNMWLVPKAQAATDDQVENLLGKALAAGKIDGKQAQEYELRYKKGADAAEIDARTQKTFDSVGSPLTADEVAQLVQ